MTCEELVQVFQTETGNHKQVLSMLWENMRGLACKISRKYSRADDFDDCLQQCFLGLYDAARNYDSGSGIPFVNYAALWFKQSVSRYQNENVSAIRLPSHIALLKNRYRRFLSDHRMKYGSDPDEVTVCRVLEITAEQLHFIKAAIQIMTACSTEAEVPGAEDITISDTIADPSNVIESIEDKIQNEQLASVLWPLVDELGADQAEVIKGRYRDNLNASEIEQSHGWYSGRAYDLERRAIWKLSHSRARRELLPFVPEIVQAKAFQGSGVNSFNRTWTSSTERAALKFLENDA